MNVLIAWLVAAANDPATKALIVDLIQYLDKELNPPSTPKMTTEYVSVASLNGFRDRFLAERSIQNDPAVKAAKAKADREQAAKDAKDK
jgi:hypothetical protein